MEKFTEKQIEFMRADLESNMAVTKFIEAVKSRFISEGRDFEKEFKEWEAKQ